jgi:hypothetical protein
MRNAPWKRPTIVEHIREDVWRYITKASSRHDPDDLLLIAGALLRMPANEVRYLAQLHFILSDDVGALLNHMPVLIRQLRPTTANQLEISTETIRGPIRWGATYDMRAATGQRHLYVTSPSYRALNTPENQVLAFALSAIKDFGARTGWHRGENVGLAAVVKQRVDDATRWLKSRQFVGIPLQAPTPVTLNRVRTGRASLRYQPAVKVVELYQKFLATLDRETIRDAVENQALIASRDDVLLELYCAFDTIKILRNLGWTPERRFFRPGIVRPPLLFIGFQEDRKIEVFYQSVPQDLSKQSNYRNIQSAHRIPVGALRPDLVIKTTSANRAVKWLLIEAKGGERDVEKSARHAAKDLLMYWRAYSPVLSKQAGPYGIGYAWGADLQPSLAADVTLCTPDTYRAALAEVLSAQSNS